MKNKTRLSFTFLSCWVLQIVYKCKKEESVHLLREWHGGPLLVGGLFYLPNFGEDAADAVVEVRFQMLKIFILFKLNRFGDVRLTHEGTCWLNEIFALIRISFRAIFSRMLRSSNAGLSFQKWFFCVWEFEEFLDQSHRALSFVVTFRAWAGSFINIG